MATYVFERFPANFHDFGPCYLTDWQIELYDAIVASMLPDVLTWYGDELLIGEADKHDPSLEGFDLDNIMQQAWGIFCGIGSLADHLVAAAKYSVALPEPGEPMYYPDSFNGDVVCDVTGAQFHEDENGDWVKDEAK